MITLTNALVHDHNSTCPLLPQTRHRMITLTDAIANRPLIIQPSAISTIEHDSNYEAKARITLSNGVRYWIMESPTQIEALIAEHS